MYDACVWRERQRQMETRDREQYSAAWDVGQVTYLDNKFPYHLIIPYHKPQSPHYTMKPIKMPSSLKGW